MAAAMGLLFAVGSADQAAAVTCGGAKVIGVGQANACSGPVPMNALAHRAAGDDFDFNPDEWTLVDSMGKAGKRGRWSTDFADETLMVVMKAGKRTAAFLFDGVEGDFAKGRFNTRQAGLIKKNGKGRRLGKMWVYARTEQPTAPVPVPAAGVMLLGGLAAFGAARVRSRKA